MDRGDFLRIVNEFGVKSIPLVGDYLAETLKDAYGGLSEADFIRKLNFLRVKMNSQECTLSYLIQQLDSDADLNTAAHESLEQLRYALDHPDEPDLAIKVVIDKFVARFEDARQYQAWATVEVRKLGDRVDTIESQLSALAEEQRTLKPRSVDDADQAELLGLFGGSFPPFIPVEAEMSDPEAQTFAGAIRMFFASQGIQTAKDQTMGSLPKGLSVARKPRRRKDGTGKLVRVEVACLAVGGR
jgi:hypothetical protein